MRLQSLLLISLLILSISAVCIYASADGEKKQAATTATAWSTPLPKSSSVVFVDGFDSGLDKWVVSTNPKFTGKWEWQSAKVLPGIEDDKGLLVGTAAAHHAIVHAFPKPFRATGKDFVVQYEVKFQQPHNCGGAYIKLFKNSNDFVPAEFSNDTPYVIMFGPDKCGSTNKVHFIFRFRNPVSGEWKEHHLSKPPTVPNDLKTHLYTLIVRADNTFQVLIDNEVKSEGSLLEKFEPPVQPPKEIDDPEDKKPEDWVDETRIPDPEAKKPEDWDEDLPAMIVDPEDKAPEGWLFDEPARIPDPEAKKPEEWDDEEDGAWQAPTIANPKCTVGCGEYKPRYIKNPAYKGKWKAPMIPNPAYKGEWKPRQIPNPAYFENADPSKFSDIGGVGVEIWTMQNDILFDNFIVSTKPADASDFAAKTFDVKRKLEDKREADENRKAKKSSGASANPWEMLLDAFEADSVEGFISAIVAIMTTHPLPFIGATMFLFIGLPLFIVKACRRRIKVVDMKKLREFEEKLKNGTLPQPQQQQAASVVNKKSEEEEKQQQEQEEEEEGSASSEEEEQQQQAVEEEEVKAPAPAPVPVPEKPKVVEAPVKAVVEEKKKPQPVAAPAPAPAAEEPSTSSHVVESMEDAANSSPSASAASRRPAAKRGSRARTGD